MILVDTSVWVDHLRGHEPELEDALKTASVAMHSIVFGELVCGNLPDRTRQIAEWNMMPKVMELRNDEVRSQIESKRLMGRGIGFADAHVLCACLINDDTLLWSRDKRLKRVAEEFGVAFSERERRKD